LYQTPQKTISVFLGPPPDLLLEDPVVGRPTPPWAPRRGRRDPDVDSGLVRACFVRIWGRSCVVPTWPYKAWPSGDEARPQTRQTSWAAAAVLLGRVALNPAARSQRRRSAHREKDLEEAVLHVPNKAGQLRSPRTPHVLEQHGVVGVHASLHNRPCRRARARRASWAGPGTPRWRCS
jgi:hypothetical protein